jgi:hypothetical protein
MAKLTGIILQLCTANVPKVTFFILDTYMFKIPYPYLDSNCMKLANSENSVQDSKLSHAIYL